MTLESEAALDVRRPIPRRRADAGDRRGTMAPMPGAPATIGIPRLLQLFRLPLLLVFGFTATDRVGTHLMSERGRLGEPPAAETGAAARA